MPEQPETYAPVCRQHPDQRMHNIGPVFGGKEPLWMCPRLSSHGANEETPIFRHFEGVKPLTDADIARLGLRIRPPDDLYRRLIARLDEAGYIAMQDHTCPSSLGNPTREEAIAALGKIRNLVATEAREWPDLLNDHYRYLFDAILAVAQQWPE